MNLTGTKRHQLQQALISAFPTPASLTQMLSFQLDQNRYVIAGGADYAEIVFNLIMWAESQGRLEELVEQAIRANPGNPALRAFSEHIRDSRSATPSAGSYTGTAQSNIEVQTEVTEITDRMTLEPALTMARRSLGILEEQAAGYTILSLPAHLRLELEDKRKVVAELEARLKAREKLS